LQSVVTNAGTLNVLTGDPAEALEEFVKINAAQGYLKTRMEEIETILTEAIRSSDTGSFSNDAHEATLESRNMRTVDNDAMREALPAEWWVRLGKIPLGELDDLLRSKLIDDEQKSLIQQAIRRGRTKASVKVKKKS